MLVPALITCIPDHLYSSPSLIFHFRKLMQGSCGEYPGFIWVSDVLMLPPSLP